MSETKYDSDFIGFADEPRLNDNGEIRSWKLTLKENHLADLEKYKTSKGNVYITLLMSKAGKPMATVYNPRSEKAIANTKSANSIKASPKKAFGSEENDDLPF